MKRLTALVALAALAASLTAPARADKFVSIMAAMTPGIADRTWVTVYRSELLGAKKDIVGSGWMGPHGAFTAYQLIGDMQYLVRAQVHVGNKIVGDTTIEVRPHGKNARVLLHKGNGNFYWTEY